MNKRVIRLYELPLVYETAASLFQRLPTPNEEVAERNPILLSKIKFFAWTFSAIFYALQTEPVLGRGRHAKHVPRSADNNRPESEPH